MITYIVVIAAVAAMLVFSFRALAGGRSVAPADYGAVVATLCAATREQMRALADALGAAAAPVTGPAALVDSAIAARKKLSGYQQELGRVDPGGDGEERVDSARSLLRAAIEDLGWACRMIEPGTYAENPGIQSAVAALQEHAAACLDGAASLTADAPAALGARPEAG